MLIIKLSGGIGNQLFQYCFARTLSKKLNEELYIDFSFFNNNTPRHAVYGLHSYNVKGVMGNFRYINTDIFILKYFFNLLYRFKDNSLVNKSSILSTTCQYLENSTERKIKFYYSEPTIFSLKPFEEFEIDSYDKINTHSYFKGFFQYNHDSKNRLFITEKFFNENLDLIHDDLRYLLPFSDKSINIAQEMEESNSVLVHVRHGDYTGLYDLGLCSKEYYKKSIEIMASKLDNPKFFIFSDDIEWTKKNLKIPFPHTFVDFEDNNELPSRGNGELLKLMSTCKHFIIANSTLSWWAAFLCENKNKIIITPEPWYQSRRVLNVETIDNKKPLRIANNNKELYDSSDKIIYELSDEEFLFKNLKINKIGDSYKIDTLKQKSHILLKDTKNITKQVIIKISLESNCFNCLNIFFKTKDNDKYNTENSLNVYYYEGDNFEHYLLLPENAILNDLKIKPGTSFENGDYIIINSLEIKEINEY